MKGLLCQGLLLLALLSAGCFTQSVLSNGDPPPNDGTVVFHLSDSAHVTSPPGKHRRVEEGYEVSGTITSPSQAQNTFEGIILDAEVTSISVSRYNPTGTVALICGAGVVLLLMTTQWGREMP